MPIKTTIRSLSISSIQDFSNENGPRLRSHDQSFSVKSTRPHQADTVAFSKFSTLWSVFKGLRFLIVFVSTGHVNATKIVGVDGALGSIKFGWSSFSHTWKVFAI